MNCVRGVCVRSCSTIFNFTSSIGTLLHSFFEHALLINVSRSDINAPLCHDVTFQLPQLPLEEEPHRQFAGDEAGVATEVDNSLVTSMSKKSPSGK